MLHILKHKRLLIALLLNMKLCDCKCMPETPLWVTRIGQPHQWPPLRMVSSGIMSFFYPGVPFYIHRDLTTELSAFTAT